MVNIEFMLVNLLFEFGDTFYLFITEKNKHFYKVYIK